MRCEGGRSASRRPLAAPVFLIYHHDERWGEWADERWGEWDGAARRPALHASSHRLARGGRFVVPETFQNLEVLSPIRLADTNAKIMRTALA